MSKNRKGIILAGGSGTRLFPATIAVCKQLLPVYDKPMIYYPLSVLLLAEIRDILIISTPTDLPRFAELLGDGRRFGVRFSYAEQPHPGGLAQGLIIGEDFIGDDPSCMILGDNIFYGTTLGIKLQEAHNDWDRATVFGYPVQDPERYGVVEFNDRGDVTDIIEKPVQPPSRYAVTGLYFYPPGVAEVAKSLKPSARGELEITDVNSHYIREERLALKQLGRGITWLDTGTHESMLEASQFVHTIEKRQSLKVCCPEEVAVNRKLIDKATMLANLGSLSKTAYGDYLRSL